MTDLLVDVANAIEDFLPKYLQLWVEETICRLEDEKPSVLKRSIHGMVKFFEDKENKGKYRRWHCLTCGCKCGNGKEVQKHLIRQRSDMYGQERFKAEVKRVRELVKRGKAERVSEGLKEELLFLRVGMALKCATLVHLSGDRITEILGDL